jgi:short-subunit dehydrogenase
MEKLVMAKTVFITGASSGLGKGIAYEMAARGYNIALAARRPLEEVAAEISSKHGVVAKAYALDVTDGDAVGSCLQQVAAEFYSLDVIIANAGIADTMFIGSGDFAAVKAIIDTNVLGLMATVESALPILRQQGSGQIVGMSSVAGERGMPGVAVYCASKSAVTTYMKALQAEIYNENIDVTILAPGYISTPLNEGVKNRPFVVDLETGVRQLVDKIERKVSFSFVPTWPWIIVGRLLRYLPNRLLAKRKR